MQILNSIGQMTADNGAIRDLRELLKMEVFNLPAFGQFFKTMFNAHHGNKVGWTGEIENLGWAQAKTCNPQYKDLAQDFAEKTWSLGRWAVPGKWCADDFENTIAEYALKQGTDIADLTGTDIMDVVIYPALQEALLKMYHRIVWFSDTAAANVSDSGVITNGVDTTLFSTTDGLWKRLFAVAAGNASQRTTIAANSETTMAAQKSKLYEAGVAIGIFEELLMNADSRIAGLEGAAIFCTDSLAKALSRDLMKEYKTALTWDKIESGVEGVKLNGVRTTEFEGVKIISFDMFDNMIQEFQNDGTKLNLPHRAFYGSPNQLLVGTPADQIISDLNVWYNEDERVVKCYAEGKIGTLIGQDNLFQIAY